MDLILQFLATECGKMQDLTIAMLRKCAYKYKYLLSKCEFFLLRYSTGRTIHINKNLAIIENLFYLQNN